MLQHTARIRAGTHQLPGPGEALRERLVPVKKLRQLSLKVTQAALQRWHTRMHVRRLALHHTANQGHTLVCHGMLAHAREPGIFSQGIETIRATSAAEQATAMRASNMSRLQSDTPSCALGSGTAPWLCEARRP